METSSFQIGELFAGRYKIEQLLGTGGMGAVYLAKDSLLGEEKVALKLLHRNLISDDKQVKRFLREVQLTRMVTHPNVVRTFEMGQEGSHLYFTMEYVPGVTLKEIIDKGRIPYEKLVPIIYQICSGLGAVHQHGVVHRDLKPGNILVTKEGNVKLTDFGVARPHYSDLTGHNEIVGSLPYMSPEIWRGSELTTSSDLYSLGVLIYELVTGQLPFDAETASEMMKKHLYEAPKLPSKIESTISPEFEAWLLILLEKEPSKRFASAEDAKEALQNSLNKKILKTKQLEEISKPPIVEENKKEPLAVKKFGVIPKKRTLFPIIYRLIFAGIVAFAVYGIQQTSKIGGTTLNSIVVYVMHSIVLSIPCLFLLVREKNFFESFKSMSLHIFFSLLPFVLLIGGILIIYGIKITDKSLSVDTYNLIDKGIVNVLTYKYNNLEPSNYSISNQYLKIKNGDLWLWTYYTSTALWILLSSRNIAVQGISSSKRWNLAPTLTISSFFIIALLLGYLVATLPITGLLSLQKLKVFFENTPYIVGWLMTIIYLKVQKS